MTSITAHPLVREPRAARRADPLLVAVVAVALGGLVVLWSLAGSSPTSVAVARTAVVVDAGGRPHAALERARSLAGRGNAVRVPRTAPEAAVDLRYFAAAGYARVVVAGPVARAAALDVAPEYPRTRFVVRR
jgi:hypothetical protein